MQYNFLAHQATHRQYKPTVSLCAIMRNEATVLERFIRLARPLTREIIIVDTGSTDGSDKIAEASGAKLLRRPWDDDFSAPRNLSIDHAQYDWILILDPDEYIDPADYPWFAALTRCWDTPAWIFSTRNYTINPAMLKFEPNDRRYPATALFPGYMCSRKTRLFQRRYNIRFHKIWHELLDYDINAKGLRSADTPLPIHHYCTGPPNRTHADRVALYSRLGWKKILLDPSDGKAWQEYAIALSIEGRITDAYLAFRRSLELGFIDHVGYASMARLASFLGLKFEEQVYKEKAICKQYENLTHINPAMKAPVIQ